VRQHADATLGWRAFKGGVFFLVALAVLVLVPAWSLTYGPGWAVLAHFAFWMAALTVYFVNYDPQLVERRLHAGPGAEREPEQKRIQLAASLAICALFAVPALDHHFGWSPVPPGLEVLGHAMIAAGFIAMFFVFRENSFASSIVEVDDGQKVIATGPYSQVRHPMYTAALVLFAGVPLALGSWWGLILVVPLVAALVLRLQAEEQLLVRELAGYADYTRRVRFRLVPGVW
jgi:protein-S-isoprenylcysteine O-methyltransferase Ste14